MAKNANDKDSIFEQDPFDMSSIVDRAEDMVVDIDMEGIDVDASQSAKELVNNIVKIYYDDEFLKANPMFKKRIDAELESFRILIKMRKADEITHDILIRAVAANSGNASLYKALTDMQKTLLSIQTKMDESMTRLAALLKNYQLEINFHENEEETPTDDDDVIKDNPHTFRGAKDFIIHMRERSDEESDESEEPDED